MMKIKICGMRDAQNIKDVAALYPDYLGFIFYERSPRCCTGLSPNTIKGLDNGIEPVMVTVDLNENDILSIADQYGFKMVQLHGDESPELCFRLRSNNFKVMKAMGIHSSEDLKSLKEYEGVVDYFLLDTKCTEKGGSGKKFNWEFLDYYDLAEPFILSGGIGPQDVEAIKRLRHSRFEGIDLNSRFEISPGVKNVQMLSKFLSSIK